MVARVTTRTAAWFAALVCWSYAACALRADDVPRASNNSLQATTNETAAKPPLELPAEGRRTVVWISIDGLRNDYLSRGEFPTLQRLQREGAFSRQLVPVVPSLTFPSHVSNATGVRPGVHGIVGNIFYDRQTREHYYYPGDGRLLDAEPIWLIATRQGIRTAVYDWTLSHGQHGAVRTAYHGERFDPRLSDQQRLEQLLHAWENDAAQPQPLRLLMGYMEGPDAVGHRYGPDSPEIAKKLQQVDRDLGEFLARALEVWRRTQQPGDTFYLLVTTDHGMAKVERLVNLDALAGLERETGITSAFTGNVAHLFFDDPHLPSRQPQRVEELLKRARQHDFAKAYRRHELPPQWQLDHPTRTGDIVIVLEPGYAFGNRLPGLLATPDEVGGPQGMHGYDPQINDKMLGFMVLWRAEAPLGGVDLGRVDALRLHPTVAALLGIEPAAKAKLPPLVGQQ